jgi:hypothetical protein
MLTDKQNRVKLMNDSGFRLQELNAIQKDTQP